MNIRKRNVKFEVVSKTGCLFTTHGYMKYKHKNYKGEDA